MQANAIRAVIADDEAPLRTYLRKLLKDVWPALEICAETENGDETVTAVEAYAPQVAFLDIRMPGLTGLQVAEQIAPACHIVFVTAFDHYAVDAFDKEAVDYLLKPVERDRLTRTVSRLEQRVGESFVPSAEAVQWLRSLIDRSNESSPPTFLQWIRVQNGHGIQLIAVSEVIYFQARDKYTAVVTRDGESLIRKPIRTLVAELDPDCFCRIHRGTIVNLFQIDMVSRSLTGRGIVRLKNRSETLTVSRSYLHLFRQM